MAKIPLEQISIRISSSEKKALQELADQKDKSFSEMARLAIQAYLYAIKHRDRKKVQLNNKITTNS